MTALVLRVFDHCNNAKAVADQEYELAKQEVQDIMSKGYHRNSKHRARFFAAIKRREQARERWLATL